MLASLVLACAVTMALGGVLPPKPNSGPSTNIVGGQEATPHDYPWQALLDVGGYQCGGSLIHNRWVLTAAHCTDGLWPSQVKVTLGAHDQTKTTAYQQDVGVSQIIQHANYNSRTMDNDIALLKLSSYISTNDGINIVSLPSAAPSAGSNVWATGWGRMKEGAFQPAAETLQEVEVPIVSQSTCRSAYIGQITDNMICAGYKEGGKDACQGDSGGPLVKKLSSLPREPKGELIGVTSWGDGCARAGKYGVYAAVNKYCTWIKDSTSSQATCQ